MGISLFWWILFLPDLSHPLFVLAKCAQYPYSVWCCGRLLGVLLGIPILLSGRESKNYRWLLFLTSLLFFPCGVVLAYLEDISCFFWLCCEVFIGLLSLETVWLLQSGEPIVFDHYYPITFILTITPLFLYYLYLDMWNVHLPALLRITPYGIVTAETWGQGLLSYVFLCYPLLWKWFQLTFRKDGNT